MASEKQIAANRLNARKSTGPRTLPGKAAVRLNSVTHGLTAKSIISPTEEGELEKLEAVRASLEADWQPQTFTETLLLDEAAACWWRILRGRAAEGFCLAVSLKHLERTIDDFTLVSDNDHYDHEHTKIEIMGTAFRARVSGQEMTRISLYAGRNFRQFYRCFQQIEQRRKNRQVEPDADLDPTPIPPGTATESLPEFPGLPDSPDLTPEPDAPAAPDATVPQAAGLHVGLQAGVSPNVSALSPAADDQPAAAPSAGLPSRGCSHAAPEPPQLPKTQPPPRASIELTTPPGIHIMELQQLIASAPSRGGAFLCRNGRIGCSERPK